MRLCARVASAAVVFVKLPAPPSAYAMTILGALQSGLVSARLFGKPCRLDAASAMLRSAVTPEGGKQQAAEADAVHP